jgi:hypothetical protein
MYVYMCMCVYILLQVIIHYIHMCIQCTHTYTYKCTHTQIGWRLQNRRYMPMPMYMHVHIYTYILHIRIRRHIHIYIYIYIYTYVHRHRHMTCTCTYTYTHTYTYTYRLQPTAQEILYEYWCTQYICMCMCIYRNLCIDIIRIANRNRNKYIFLSGEESYACAPALMHIHTYIHGELWVCPCVDAHTYIHTYMESYGCVPALMHIHTYIHTYMESYGCVPLRTRYSRVNASSKHTIHICMHTCIYRHMHAWIHIVDACMNTYCWHLSRECKTSRHMLTLLITLYLFNHLNLITGQNERKETTQITTVTKSAACASYKSNHLTSGHGHGLGHGKFH